MTTYKRILAILQLVFCFTVVIWSLGIPFLGEVYAFKSKASLYKYLMGEVHGSENPSLQQKLERNRDRFTQLPQELRETLQKDLQTLQSAVGTPWYQKSYEALKILLFKLPLFERVWIVLAIVISIMVLLGKSSTSQIVWLLPAIALCYGIDNRYNGQIARPEVGQELYPSEKFIIDHYLQEPLSDSIEIQREQLLKGWQIYLIREWTKERPSEDPSNFIAQAEIGEYAFNLSRLQKMRQHPSSKIQMSYLDRESIPNLALYIVWNLLFAVCICV